MGNPEVNPATGGVVPESILGSQGGGRRRRRTAKGKTVSRKGGRKGRRMTRRRAMRGGAGVVNSAVVGYGYGGGGTITSGPTDVKPYAANGPVPGGPTVGADWVAKSS